jgi:hypothetical protein
MLTLLLAASACDRRNAQQPTAVTRAVSAPVSLDERLLETLDDRRQWRSNAVKIWLTNPTVATDLSSSKHKSVRVHAWPHNQNDFNTAMMRLNGGDILYAITDNEFEELRTRAAAEKIP